MERKISALPVAFSGFLLGLIGYFFFYEKSVGLSFPIYTVLIIGVTLLLVRRNGTSFTLRKMWVLLPIIFFAFMTAIRASEVIFAINLLAIAALLALWVHFLTRQKHLDTTSFIEQILIAIAVGIATVIGSISEFIGLAKWLSKHDFSNAKGTMAVLRGVALTIPIIIIFAVLLSSADLVFAQQLTSIFSIFQFDNLDAVITSLMTIGGLSLLATGFLSYAVSESITTIDADAIEEQPTQADPEKPKNSGFHFRLGLIETGIILTSVLLLFGFFVMIQFTYLFGANDVIADGVTLSDYARRGFFELVAVSCLTLGLMLVLDKLTLRQSTTQHSIFRGQSVLLVLLTLVMLASAWQRMSLYELAYGFTHLRLFTHIFMVCLGALLVFGLLSVFRVRQHIFSLGILLVIIGYAVSLNILNVDNYIASHNIERYQAGEDLDMCYLSSLSADALTAMLELENSGDAEIEQRLNNWFYGLDRREKQRRETYNPLLEWHWMNSRVFNTLTDRDIEFEANYSTSYCYRY